MRALTDPRPSRLIVVLIAVVSLLAAACAGGASEDRAGDGETTTSNGGETDDPGGTEASGEPIVLGALYPLTGPLAAFGVQQTNGLKIAVDFVNERGGVNGRPVELTFVDATSSDEAVSGAERLVQQGVPLIFGTASSGFSLAASPVAERAGVVYVETGALNHALVERGFQWYFRTRGGNQTYAGAAVDSTADVIADALGKSVEDMTAVVLHEDGPFGTEFGDFMPAAVEDAGLGGPEIVSIDAYSIADTQDFTPIIQKYKQLQPDVIYWGAFAPDSILFWRQSQQQGYTPPSVIAFTSGPGTPDFFDAFGPEGTNGVLVLDTPLVTQGGGGADPEAAQVFEDFTQEYATSFPDDPLTGNAIVGFIGGWAVLHEVLPLASDMTPEGIQAALGSVDLPEGSLPNGWGLNFNDNGQNEGAFPALHEWQDGVLVPVWPDDVAAGEVQFLPISR